MNSLKNFLKQIKWYEYLMLAIFYATVITVGVVFNSGALVIINTLLGILYVFLTAKGVAIANAFGMVQVILYAVISYLNSYYGEIVICALNFVICTITLVFWLKNKKKGSVNVKVGKPVKWKEWLLVVALVGALFVVFYFILKAFDTPNLVVSAISVATSAGAGYLLARRSEYSFIFYILNNIMALVLWATIVADGDMTQLPTMMNYAIFLLLNIVGIVNWAKMKKIQNNENEQKSETTEIVKENEGE